MLSLHWYMYKVWDGEKDRQRLTGTPNLPGVHCSWQDRTKEERLMLVDQRLFAVHAMVIRAGSFGHVVGLPWSLQPWLMPVMSPRQIDLYSITMQLSLSGLNLSSRFWLRYISLYSKIYSPCSSSVQIHCFFYLQNIDFRACTKHTCGSA